MVQRRPPRSKPAREADEPSYWQASRRPLQMLVFLAPLVIAYEVGLAWVLRTEQGVLTNKAHETLLSFFQTMGVSAAGGLYLGGIVIVVVLLVWQVLNRDPWRIDGTTTGLMACESLLLTLPLLAVGILVQRNLPATAQSGGIELARLDLWSKMAISVGAGLYEELLFRMMIIAVVHTLLVDLAGLTERVGIAAAVVVSSIAFTVYHPLRGPEGLLIGRVLFYMLAGLYFGVIYVVRGFGIVVTVHALYDVITVSLLSEPG